MNKYGGFNEESKFVITNPYTPEPWLHYLIRVNQPGTETFCSGVSYTAGGFDVRGTHENTFVDTQLHLNDEDDMGRYIYIYDKDTKDLVTTTWQPTRVKEQTLKTTFEFGKVTFESEYKGLESFQEMYVPEDFDGWIQNVKLTNTTSSDKNLTLYPFVPMHMGDALDRLLAGDNDGFFGGSSYDNDLNAIVFRRNHGIAVKDNPEDINGMLGNVAAFYSTLNVDNNPYDTNMENFFGNRFNNQKNPGAILTGDLKSEDTPYLRRACGVFKNEVVIKPGETLEFAVALIAGSTNDYYSNNKTELKEYIELVNNSSKRVLMADNVTTWWDNALNRLKLTSPDSKLNHGFKWLQYQCEIVYILNRMKSRYHTGYEYGWGFRDILQDVLYTFPYRAPEMAEVLKHISNQMFSSGKAYHNFFIDQLGNKSVEASDDPIWFANAIVKYCKETGNFDFLDVITDYADVKEGMGDKSGSILEHCIKGLDSVWNDCSDRHLPYMKDCDWNDDLNENRIGDEPNRNVESVMVAQQLYSGLLDLVDIFIASGKNLELVQEYQDRASKIKKSIKDNCMDKEGYFKRTLTVDGSHDDLGSSDNEFAKIFLEPQAFGINSGVADKEQANASLDAVKKYLDSDWGAMLCFPVYTDLTDNSKLPKRTWNIEKEPPAMKENGGIFMHLNAWLVQSYCMVGRGQEAVDHYLKNLPENMSVDQDVYMSEPYVYPEYVRGKGIESHGRGGHTWLTGTAPTMHMALTEYIYGVRAHFDGLEIDPCVSPEWKNFSMERNFRNARYDIQVSNPNGVEKGINNITVDGETIEGNILPVFSDNKTHIVMVEMG
ncbi:MAG: hypothetical protein OCD02_17415 [Spirochaetaceae bacterium]